MRILTKKAYEGMKTKIEKLERAVQAYEGAGLRYEEKIARKDRCIAKLSAQLKEAIVIARKYMIEDNVENWKG